MDLAHIGFRADTAEIDRASRRLDHMSNQGTSAGRSLAKLAGVVGTVVAAFASMSKIVDVGREFDILNSQLITATGSAKNAAVAFGAIQKFAAETPYDLAQATNAFTQLVNLGLNPSQAALTSYGNTASAMGKDLSQMVEAVADATVGEFERLKEFGIKSSVQGDQVSFTFRGVTETVKKEAGAIEGYLTSLGENEFAGAMAVRADTLDGSISNLGDTWDTLFLTISNAGVSGLIRDGVEISIESIQSLTNYLASGALVNSFDAFVGRFDSYVKDINASMNIISEIVGESSDGWGESIDGFFGNMLEGFKVLPEMTRFFIQAAAVNIGAFVDYAKIYGDQFVSVLSLRFQEMVEKAKLYGVAIGNAVNPFGDDFDLDAELANSTQKYQEAEQVITQAAQKRADAITNIKEDLINGYALESIAETDSYKKRIAASNEMLDQYLLEKEASSGDVLKQFKIEPISNEVADSVVDVTDKVKDLKKELDDSEMFSNVTGGIADSLNAMKGFAKDGSKEFQALSIAADAFNLVQAIGAVINQAASGDPYSAFPRMAAMIGAMASLGQSIGGFGGGSMQDESAANQAVQGLNQVGEKSSSISDAIESTADATDKLVGINTNMLRALESLQKNISGASSIVARGASDVDINPPSRVDDNPLSFITDNSAANIFGSNIFTEVFDFLGLNWLFEGIGSLLGGSSSTVDTGIRIIGGEIGDLLESVTVQAFEEIKSKKYAWRSSNYDTYFAPLDNASTQFGLVFQSLADSVFEGATSLGISGSNAIDAINRFQVETTKISLKGLSADDQQAEIEAVFSKIFNDLALAVVPFAADFQQAGEEIGATLSRISTQVAVADFAVTNLGIDLGEKLGNSKLYVRIADNLSMMTGGIEDFASKISSFVEDFAPESVKFSLFSNTLKDALSDVGLEVPATTEGFYNLMASLDGTTAAGQQQIAALLNSQDVASGYFDLLEDRNEELDSFSDSLLTLTDNLRGAIVSIYGTSVAASTLSLNSALEAARIGDFSEALGLNLSNLNPNQSNFGSIQSFNIEQAKTANKLAELADLTAGTATVEDMALTAAQEQVALLGSINTNIASASVPQVQQAQNNDNIVIELKSIKADIEKIKQADQAIAKSSAKSANHLETMEYDGVDVRVEA